MGQCCSKCNKIFCDEPRSDIAEDWIRKNGSLYDNDQLPNKVQNGFEWAISIISMFHFVIAVGILIFGIYTYSLRQELASDEQHLSNDRVIYQISLIPIYLIVVGCIVIIVSLMGIAGILRHHLPLMIIYLVFLVVYSVAQLILAILALTMKSRIEASIYDYFTGDALANYRDDIDLQNIIDFFQMRYKCCGGSDQNGYLDWSKNMYFACSSLNPSIERCGVPYSCCMNATNPTTGDVSNVFCGYRAQTQEPNTAGKYIYTSGCVQAVFASLQTYSGAIVAAICALIIVPIVLEVMMVLLIRDVTEERKAYKDWEAALQRGDQAAVATGNAVEAEEDKLGLPVISSP